MKILKVGGYLVGIWVGLFGFLYGLGQIFSWASQFSLAFHGAVVLATTAVAIVLLVIAFDWKSFKKEVLDHPNRLR